MGTPAPTAGGTPGFSFGAVGAGDASKTIPTAQPLNAQPKPGLSFGTTGFGVTPSTGMGFNLGGAPATNLPASGGLTFGTAPAATPAASLSFGTPAAQNTSLTFGSLATAPASTGFNLSTTPAAAPAATGFNLGRTPTASTTPATGLSFGTPKTAAGGGFTMGGTTATIGGATNLTFGTPVASAANTFSIGATTAAPAATGYSTGVTPAAATAAPTGLTISSISSSGTAGFNLSSTLTPTSAPVATATLTPSAPPAPISFNLGGAPASTAAGGTTFNLGTPAPSSFALSAPATTSAGTGFNLVGSGTTPATSAYALGKSTAPAAATSAPQTTLGSITTVTSSTGSVGQTGAINFCQLEESINKWTLELEEQEKAFVNQATQVNAWDRLLIVNGEKIVTLNQEVERVKLEQQQLEHELDYVVGQQRELQDCLVPLEKELASMSVSDPEREYTYRLAENLDTQLKQMSEDLKEIIEHLNEANRSQDSSDPIVQIGKILNAHMNSLQWLDQRTALLGQKIQQIDQMHQNFRQENERNFSLAYN